MIISYSKKFVVFAAWKCASQTLHARLEPLNQSPYPRFFYYNDNIGRLVHQHITCSDFLFLPEAQQNLFKCSFVRNPYDRVYSGFLQLQRDVKQQRDMKFQTVRDREIVLNQIAEIEAALIDADYDFNAWIKSIRRENVFYNGLNSNFPLHPSHFWTHINGRQYVDFIGKVEHFERDYSAMKNHLHLAATSSLIVNENITNPKSNFSTDYRYIEKMNQYSISRINDLFALDFDLFDYKKLPD